jgi:hypothetical protein
LRDLHEWRVAIRYGRIGMRNRRNLADLLFLFTTSASQFLGERFESEHVKAALGWHAINDSVAGPSTPGTAYVLLHDHASEETGGGPRSWGFVRGGMSRLPDLMADAAREAGAEVRTGAEVGASSRTAVPSARLAPGRSCSLARDLERRPEAHVLKLVESASSRRFWPPSVFRSNGTSTINSAGGAADGPRFLRAVCRTTRV